MASGSWLNAASADCLAGVVLGLLGVTLVVALGTGRRIERRAFRKVVAFGDEKACVAETRREHLAFADRRLHRLAQRSVGCHAFLGVEHEVGEAERRRQD